MMEVTVCVSDEPPLVSRGDARSLESRDTRGWDAADLDRVIVLGLSPFVL